MLTLISSSPSPYARKVRIALAEKEIPFTLQTEVPWDSGTATPNYNPLEKLPVLILDDGNSAVYESRFILEWLEAKYPQRKRLLPPAEKIDLILKARQIEVVVDGVCDALVLSIWEGRRDESKRSEQWAARQTRKVEGGLEALAAWVEEAEGGFLVDNQFGLADLAVGSMLGFLSFRYPDHAWKTTYPHMEKYRTMLEERPSFKGTTPAPFERPFREPVV